MCIRYCNKPEHKDYDKVLKAKEQEVAEAQALALAQKQAAESQAKRAEEYLDLFTTCQYQLAECRAGGTQEPCPPPTSTIEITYSDVDKMVSALNPICLRYLDDNRYWVPPVEEYKAVVMYLAVYKYPYVTEKFDCNKFTKALAALTSLQAGWEGTPCFDVQYKYAEGVNHSEMLVALSDKGIVKPYIVEAQQPVNGVSFREAEEYFTERGTKPHLVKQ